ncbi:MAG: GatB/YqeY domain-containing protein [Patescibacteria group bacterium]
MTKNDLQKQIQEAMKAGDSVRVSTLRLLSNAIHNEEIAMKALGQQRDLTHEEELALVRRQLKQREEAVEAYEKGGRAEAAEKERQEAGILKEFLPQQMSEDELSDLVNKAIEESEARDFGQIMKHVMVEVKGRADGKQVSSIVQNKLK